MSEIKSVLEFLFNQLTANHSLVSDSDLNLLIVYLFNIHTVFPKGNYIYNELYQDICDFILFMAGRDRINLLHYIRLYPTRVLEFYDDNHQSCRSLLLASFKNATQIDIINILNDNNSVAVSLLCDLYKAVNNYLTKGKVIIPEEILYTLQKNILSGIVINGVDEITAEIAAKYGGPEMLIELYELSEIVGKLDIENIVVEDKLCIFNIYSKKN